jgi:WD40 repeat protein
LRGHEREVFRLTTSSSERWLVSQGIDGSVRAWDLQSAHSAASPVQVADTGIVGISPDGRWLVRSRRTDGPVAVSDLRGPGSVLAPVDIPNTRSISSTAFHFSSDGRWLIVSEEHEPAVLVDLSTRNPASASWTLASTANPAFVVFSRDTRWLAVASKSDRVSGASDVRVWRLDRAPPGAPSILRDPGISSLEFDPRGRWLLASTYSKNPATLWSLPKLTSVNGAAPIAGQPLSPTRARFISDGNGVVASGADGWVRFWDVSGDVAKLQREVNTQMSSEAMHLSPDGRWMLTTGGGMRLWDLRRSGAVSPHPLRADEPSYPGPVVRFTPDGKRLITTHADGVVRVWNLDEADPTAGPTLLKGFNAPGPVAISANGRWLAAMSSRPITGPPDPTVRLLDLTSANPAAKSFELLGHEGIPSLAFSSDERWLVTGSTDDTLRFWDLAAEDPSAAPMTLPAFAPVTALSTDAAGRFVVSTHSDGFARLWPLRLAELLAVAENVAGRNLSQQEWKRFFQQEPYRRTFATFPLATEIER